MFDIVGIGASLYDMTLTISRFPKEDTKMEVLKTGHQCGGPAATGVATASKLGASAAFLGLFTDDDYAKAMIADFRKYNVDTSGIAILEGYVSGTAVVINTEDSSSRTILWTKGTLPSPTSKEIPEETIKQAKILYLDGNHHDAALYACKIAKSNNVKILIDAGAMYQGVKDLLEYADIIIASEEFAVALSGSDSVEESMLYLKKEYNPEILVVTRGELGGCYLDGEKTENYPCYPPPGKVVNTNGAGDVFHGAFAYAYLNGCSLKKSIHFASAASSIKCTKQAVREGVPSAEEIIRYLEEHDMKIVF